jgi:hypothetical protein
MERGRSEKYFETVDTVGSKCSKLQISNWGQDGELAGIGNICGWGQLSSADGWDGMLGFRAAPHKINGSLPLFGQE